MSSNDRHEPQNPFAPAEYAKLTGFEGSWRDTWWRRDFLKMLVARWGLDAAPGALLDVGCGVGHWGRTLAPLFDELPELHGIDIEQAFVERAASAAGELGLEATYCKGSADAIPYEDDRFDIVTCQTVMMHVPDAAAAIAEMRRVLRPGGLMLLAEPNNIAGYLSYLMSQPRPGWQYVRQQLDFYYICMNGKIACGMGDSSIGDQLPALLAAAGLVDIDVALNESCPALVPPYPSARQQIERDFLREHIEGGSWWMGFGPRENALRFYRAGGGKDDDFDRIWPDVMAFQQRVAENLDAESYTGGRGPMMYLVTGRKAA
ncbi:MAG: class I SAM-dependent methyltransferase [Myxococcales bacterium]|nr:class I SAM-dependent methyltransferase [Myxococcales bacterium]